MNSRLKRSLFGFIALDCLGLALLISAANLSSGANILLCLVHGFVAFGAILMTALGRLPRPDHVRFAALVCGVLFVGLLLAAFTYIAVSQPDYLAFAPEERYGFQDGKKVHLALLVCICLVFLLVAGKAEWITYIATHRAFFVAQVLLVVLWVGAFARILSTEDFPPSDLLPEGCVFHSLDEYDESSTSLLGADSHSNPTRLLLEQHEREVSLTFFRGDELVATRRMPGTNVRAIHALGGGYVVWRRLGRWPARHLVMEQLNESLRPIHSTTFSAPGRTSVLASSADSYCLVTGKHRYTFLDANLRRRPATTLISEWLEGTSMISAWASLIVLLFWWLTGSLSHVRWCKLRGLRFDGIWRGRAGEACVEVDGEIYRVRLAPEPIEIWEGEPCVLFATGASEELRGPYRGAPEVLVAKRLYAGRWSELEAQHRVNLRGLGILVLSVLWVLSATAFELIFV